MPLIETSPHTYPYLRYDAPINEGTKKVREMFKVDEESGYPEHYKWRRMAKLGPRYKPEDIFKHLGHHEPERELSTNLFLIGGSTIMATLGHVFRSIAFKRPFRSNIYYIPIYAGILSYSLLWYREKKQYKMGLKNKIYIDYLQKHPERFGEVYRPKIRECLLWPTAIR